MKQGTFKKVENIAKGYTLKVIGNMIIIDGIKNKKGVISLINLIKEKHEILPTCFKDKKSHFKGYKNHYTKKGCKENPITSLLLKYSKRINNTRVEFSTIINDEQINIALIIPKTSIKTGKKKCLTGINGLMKLNGNLICYGVWAMIWFDIDPDELTDDFIENIVKAM